MSGSISTTPVRPPLLLDSRIHRLLRQLRTSLLALENSLSAEGLSISQICTPAVSTSPTWSHRGSRIGQTVYGIPNGVGSSSANSNGKDKSKQSTDQKDEDYKAQGTAAGFEKRGHNKRARTRGGGGGAVKAQYGRRRRQQLLPERVLELNASSSQDRHQGHPAVGNAALPQNHPKNAINHDPVEGFMERQDIGRASVQEALNPHILSAWPNSEEVSVLSSSTHPSSDLSPPPPQSRSTANSSKHVVFTFQTPLRSSGLSGECLSRSLHFLRSYQNVIESCYSPDAVEQSRRIKTPRGQKRRRVVPPSLLETLCRTVGWEIEDSVRSTIHRNRGVSDDDTSDEDEGARVEEGSKKEYDKAASSGDSPVSEDHTRKESCSKISERVAGPKSLSDTQGFVDLLQEHITLCDEWYDAIPSHCHAWVLVQHATSIVMDSSFGLTYCILECLMRLSFALKASYEGEQFGERLIEVGIPLGFREIDSLPDFKKNRLLLLAYQAHGFSASKVFADSLKSFLLNSDFSERYFYSPFLELSYDRVLRSLNSRHVFTPGEIELQEQYLIPIAITLLEVAKEMLLSLAAARDEGTLGVDRHTQDVVVRIRQIVSKVSMNDSISCCSTVNQKDIAGFIELIRLRNTFGLIFHSIINTFSETYGLIEHAATFELRNLFLQQATRKATRRASQDVTNAPNNNSHHSYTVNSVSRLCQPFNNGSVSRLGRYFKLHEESQWQHFQPDTAPSDATGFALHGWEIVEEHYSFCRRVIVSTRVSAFFPTTHDIFQIADTLMSASIFTLETNLLSMALDVRDRFIDVERKSYPEPVSSEAFGVRLMQAQERCIENFEKQELICKKKQNFTLKGEDGSPDGSQSDHMISRKWRYDDMIGEYVIATPSRPPVDVPDNAENGLVPSNYEDGPNRSLAPQGNRVIDGTPLGQSKFKTQQVDDFTNSSRDLSIKFDSLGTDTGHYNSLLRPASALARRERSRFAAQVGRSEQMLRQSNVISVPQGSRRLTSGNELSSSPLRQQQRLRDSKGKRYLGSQNGDFAHQLEFGGAHENNVDSMPTTSSKVFPQALSPNAKPSFVRSSSPITDNKHTSDDDAPAESLDVLDSDDDATLGFIDLTGTAEDADTPPGGENDSEIGEIDGELKMEILESPLDILPTSEVDDLDFLSSSRPSYQRNLKQYLNGHYDDNEENDYNDDETSVSHGRPRKTVRFDGMMSLPESEDELQM